MLGEIRRRLGAKRSARTRERSPSRKCLPSLSPRLWRSAASPSSSRRNMTGDHPRTCRDVPGSEKPFDPVDLGQLVRTIAAECADTRGPLQAEWCMGPILRARGRETRVGTDRVIGERRGGGEGHKGKRAGERLRQCRASVGGVPRWPIAGRATLSPPQGPHHLLVGERVLRRTVKNNLAAIDGIKPIADAGGCAEMGFCH